VAADPEASGRASVQAKSLKADPVIGASQLDSDESPCSRAKRCRVDGERARLARHAPQPKQRANLDGDRVARRPRKRIGHHVRRFDPRPDVVYHGDERPREPPTYPSGKPLQDKRVHSAKAMRKSGHIAKQHADGNPDVVHRHEREGQVHLLLERHLRSKPPEQAEDDGELWDVKETARRLGRCTKWIREKAKAGELPYVRLDGGALMFDPDDVRAFARARRVSLESR